MKNAKVPRWFALIENLEEIGTDCRFTSARRFPSTGAEAQESPRMLFAYLGPETVLPLTSVVAAVTGVVMMFGRNSVRFVIRMFRGRGQSPEPVKPLAQPHFRLGKASRSQVDSPQS